MQTPLLTILALSAAVPVASAATVQVQDAAPELQAVPAHFSSASDLVGRTLRSRMDADGDRKELGGIRDFVVDAESGLLTHVIITSGDADSESLRRLKYSELRFDRTDVESKAVVWIDLSEADFIRITPISEKALEPYRGAAILASQRDDGARAAEAGSEEAATKAREAQARASALMLVSELDDLVVLAPQGSSGDTAVRALAGTQANGQSLGQVDEAWIDCTTGRVMYLSLDVKGRKVVAPYAEFKQHVDVEGDKLCFVAPCTAEQFAKAPALDPSKQQTLDNAEFRRTVDTFYAERQTGSAPDRKL